MSYNYSETVDEIVIDKGIPTREIWKRYDDGRDEFASYEELAKALELRNRVPLVIDTEHDHTQPLRNPALAVGYADLSPCPEKRGLKSTWHLRKSRLPRWLLDAIHRRDPIPVSPFQYVNVDAGQQRDIMFDHIAILQQSEPRCPIERCGIGVYDAMTQEPVKEEPKPSEPEPKIGRPKVGRAPVMPEAMLSAAPTAEKAAAPPEAPTPPAGAKVEPHAVPLEEVQTLQKQLQAAQAELTKIRQPAVDELTVQGYEPKELATLGTDTLQRMVLEARAARTQGLPGAVPKPPPPPPKTRAEQREDVYQKHLKESTEAQKKRWQGW